MLDKLFHLLKRPKAPMLSLAVAVILGGSAAGEASAKEDRMELKSSAFENGAAISRKYTCEGDDVAPPLAWTGVPAGAKSLALIVDDPDAPDPRAPERTWVHWVVYGMPATSKGIGEGGKIPEGAHVGLNDWKRESYGGPCPPVGRHRYFFKLYALDQPIDTAKLDKTELEKAMKGHVLAEARLMGTYEKQKRRGAAIRTE